MKRVSPKGLAALLLCAALGVGCTASLYSDRPRYYEPHEASFVPPGYLPPPTMCRIWHQGRTPEQQPPPGECSVLRAQVPAGAVLVYGGS